MSEKKHSGKTVWTASAMGRKGGSVTGPTKARSSRVARKAANARWRYHWARKAAEQARRETGHFLRCG
jgi:hypothetical protein